MKACWEKHTDGAEKQITANLTLTRWIQKMKKLFCFTVFMSALQASDRLILRYMRPDGNYGITVSEK